jgi:hypothetical protein
MENEGGSTNLNQEPTTSTQPVTPSVPEATQQTEAPSPVYNANPEPVYPVQPENNIYVGMGGSNLPPEKKGISKKLVINLVLIAIAFVVIATGLFAYRYFYMPPSNWSKTEDTKTGISFYFPKCDVPGTEDKSASFGYAKEYTCGVNSPKAFYGVAILSLPETQGILGVEDALNQYYQSDGSSSSETMTFESKKNLTKSGNPAIEYEATLKSGSNTGKIRGVFYQKKGTNTFASQIMMDNYGSIRFYNIFTKSLKIN